MPTAPRRPKPTTSVNSCKPVGYAPPRCFVVGIHPLKSPTSSASPARLLAPGTPPGPQAAPAPLQAEVKPR
jgi:hypothetical protein